MEENGRKGEKRERVQKATEKKGGFLLELKETFTTANLPWPPGAPHRNKRGGGKRKIRRCFLRLKTSGSLGRVWGVGGWGRKGTVAKKTREKLKWRLGRQGMRARSWRRGRQLESEEGVKQRQRKRELWGRRNGGRRKLGVEMMAGVFEE